MRKTLGVINVALFHLTKMYAECINAKIHKIALIMSMCYILYNDILILLLL